MKPYTCLFPGGKYKALTLSYDDGLVQDVRFIALLNAYALKGTFHLNGRYIDATEDMAEYHYRLQRQGITDIYAGHEISGHSLTHPSLPDCDDETLVHEIAEDQRILSALTARQIKGFSYPFGNYDDRVKAVLADHGFQYARTVHSTKSFALPTDWLAWHPTCHQTEDLLELTQRFNDPERATEVDLLCVWGHAFEFDDEQVWEVIAEFVQQIDHERVWSATCEALATYAKACEQLVYDAKAQTLTNPTAVPIWYTHHTVVYMLAPGATQHGIISNER